MKLNLPIVFIAGLVTSTVLYAATRPVTDVAEAANRVLNSADRMAEIALETSNQYAGAPDECAITAGLAARATILGLRADLTLAVASCVNEESSDFFKFLACLYEAFDDYQEGLEELEEVHKARLALCGLTGGGIYDPDLDEDAFVEGVYHEFLPLTEGSIWVYRSMTDEGLEEITVEVTDQTVEIDEIECIAVRDTVRLNGVLVEDTFDWFAQHEDGTVWYLGEIAVNYEDGEISDLEGSWKAGEEGGLPGKVMLATPTLNTTYRQELLLTEAEDAATVIELNATARTQYGDYAGCIVTADFTPLEPDALEHKYYAPGIGLVLETKPGTSERLELFSFTPGP